MANQSGKGYVNEEETENSKGYAESPKVLPLEEVRRYNLR